MSAPPEPSAAPVTCTVDERPPRAPDAPATLGPVPPEVAQARAAQDATALSLLARHADPRVRAAVAGNPHTPEEALTALADDAEGAVIEAVASNPALPDALFVDLYERPRARKGANTFEALYRNGDRGAYARSLGHLAWALLYLFGGVFFLADLLTYAFGVTKGPHPTPPGSPLALQGLVASLCAVLLARAMSPLERLTVARLRTRSVLPKVAMWLCRVAVVALLAVQIRACATWS